MRYEVACCGITVLLAFNFHACLSDSKLNTSVPIVIAHQTQLSFNAAALIVMSCVPTERILNAVTVLSPCDSISGETLTRANTTNDKTVAVTDVFVETMTAVIAKLAAKQP
jgi:hypothetical protein